MARDKSDLSTEILQYALRHLEKERDDLQIRIDGLRKQLGRRSGSQKLSQEQPRAPRVLSESARRRIGAAQKKRWAEYR
ncbi:MAG: hypothetical protein ABUS51_01655, partial [Acidobacteriota bacterium]